MGSIHGGRNSGHIRSNGLLLLLLLLTSLLGCDRLDGLVASADNVGDLLALLFVGDLGVGHFRFLALDLEGGNTGLHLDSFRLLTAVGFLVGVIGQHCGGGVVQGVGCGIAQVGAVGEDVLGRGGVG